MLKRCVNISLAASLGAGSLLNGQGMSSYQPPAAQPTQRPATSQAGISAPTSGSLESNTFLTMADRVFNPDSDSMDFENGSFVWKGRSFNLVNQRAFRARLERFLLSEPNADDENYAVLMQDILDRLSVAQVGDEDDILETWELLFRASEFVSDGGNSTIVANQVFNAWRIRKESRGVALSQRELEQIREYQQEVVANRALMIEKLKDRQAQESVRMSEGSGKGKGKKGKGSGNDTQLASEAAFRALDLVETEAKLLALEGQAATTAMVAKLQFQSQIVSFLQQRRFQHALVLCGFYQLIFKGSQQQLEVGKDQLQSFFPNSDLSFTVDTIAFVSNEAINDIRKGVDSINTAYDEDRQLIALERLQETFFLGEYVPELNLIPKEQRRHLLDLYRSMMEANELAEAKDYNGVAEMAAKIQALAKDFPVNRVLSSIETAKSMSDMAVFAASQYRNLGDIDKARDELQTAIEIWPSNPAIRDFQQETTRMATAGSQGVVAFDDLYKRNDYRGIYENRMELGFALAEDPQRRPLLMEVIDQISRIELLVAQSTELDTQGEPYAAWELLAEAAKISADDSSLNKARAELAPRVADFVQYLDRADRQATDGHPAGSLAAYLTAQDIYPASRICREGIEKQSSRIMALVKSNQAGDVVTEEQ